MADNDLAQNLSYKKRNQDGMGLGTAFDTKYDVKKMQYPDNLMSDTGSYGGNYVIFYINVNEDSKLVKQYGDSAFVEDLTPRQRGDAVGTNMSKSAFITGSTAAGAVGGGAAAIGFNTDSKLLTAATGGLVGAAAGALVASETSTFSRKQRRMKEAIALHIPVDMNVKYGVNWAEEDTATTAALYAGADKALDALTAGFKSDTTFAGAGSEAVNIAKSKLVATALSVPGAGDYASATTGMAANPKKEQLFKGVDYRTFTFTYQFFPRDSKEAKQVRDIIQAFKLHMHPEFKDEYNFLYLYPSEFDIYYYQNGKENMNLHRHTSCVLTDLNVNYNPQGVFTSFDDGMPTQINISLTFKELALLTKDHIQDGF